MSIRKIFRSVSQVFISNIANGVVNILILVVLARSFDTDLVGDFLLFYSCILIAAGALEFGSANTLIVYGARDTLDSRDVFRQVLTVSASLSLVFLPVLLFVSYGMLGFEPSITGLLLLATIGYLLYRLSLALFQARGAWLRYALSNVLLNVCRLLGVLVVAIALGAAGGLPALAAVVTIAIVSMAVLNIVAADPKVVGFKAPSSEIRHSMVNLGIANIVSLLIFRGDPLVIATFFGRAEIAVYSLSASIALSVSVLTLSIGPVYLRYISRHQHFPLSIYLTYLKIVGLIAGALLLALPFTDTWFGLIFGERFVSGAAIFNWLVVAHVIGLSAAPLEQNSVRRQPSVIVQLKIAELVIYFGCVFLLAERIGFWALVTGMIAMRLGGTAFLLFSNILIWREAELETQ